MIKKPLLILILSVLLPFSVSGQGKRLALIIGNGNYTNTQPLSNPVNDANSVYFMLNKLGFDLLKYEDLTQTDMKKAIDDFGEKLKKYDVGLFYYAGHGVQVDGSNYLLPVDANLKSEKDVDYECIDAGKVLSKFDVAGTKTSIIILDACRNNPFAKSWSRGIKDKGLAFMEAPPGALIAYSTSPGSVAFDGSGTNGLYTECLLQSIGDPELNLIQVFQKVRKMVRERSAGVQIPWESTSMEGDFYFNQIGLKLTYTGSSSLPEAEKEPGRKQIMMKIKSVKSNPSLIRAEGKGSNSNEADRIAKQNLEMMITDSLISISKAGKQSASQLSEEIRKGGREMILEELQPFMNRNVYVKGTKSFVLRYVLKSDIDILLKQKKDQILSTYDMGMTAENNFEIGDALKYYYWAYSLTALHPGCYNIVIQGKNGTETLALDYLSEKIATILSSISCKVVDTAIYEGNKRAELKFTYKNSIIKNIDFRFWNGTGWSEENCVNNEIGFVDLNPDRSISDLKIEVVYNNLNKSKFDKTIQRAVQLAEADKFKQECTIIQDFSRPGKIQLKVADYSKYYNAIKDVISKVKKKDSSINENLFTRNGYEIYKALLLYGNVTFLKESEDYPAFSLDNFTHISGIPVRFRFRNNSVDFFEKLSFQFDSAGRIDNISFGLSDRANQDILSQTRWPEECKFQIINFLENYKTAYALERYDYIDKIFSDNALIIVGQRVEESEKVDDNQLITFGENYKLIKLTKEQYMYRLRKVFEKNEFINIQFEENIVKRRDNESNVYGINIKQNYFSTNYADQGNLFLMVDLKERDRPVIYVRAWQPEDFAGKHIINLSDFSF
ncbi:MAG: caspase family protein [Bacteroidia bacterium]|nr:caspase family protein [Bacteroidia bacterium]